MLSHKNFKSDSIVLYKGVLICQIFQEAGRKQAVDYQLSDIQILL